MSASGSDASVEEQQQEWDDWSEDESSGFRSLFEDRAFGSLEEVLAFDAKEHDFDLRQFRAQHGLDHYDTIRCLNYIRGEVAAGRDPKPVLLGRASADAWPWAHDRFLQPVLPDDELLFHDWEDEDAETAAAAAAAGPSRAGEAAGSSPAAAAAVQAELAQVREENASLRAVLAAMQSLVLQDEVMHELAAEAAGAWAGPSAEAAADSTGPSDSTGAGASQQQQLQSAEAAGIDKSYFDSYSTFDIHHDMLADKVRTEAYRAALEQNPGLLQGARVLDVGCGTGILSMFAARGGAARVVGVDGSNFIAGFARANVQANQLSEAVTIVASKIEQLTELPAGPAEDMAGQQVDVLVSEWMGYALFFESMLDSVLLARDRFLRPGGAVLPDLARVYLAPARAGATGIPFWHNVYGFSMPSIASSLHHSALKEVIVRTVPASEMLGEGVEVRSFDLATMAPAGQDFTAAFKLTVGQGPVECAALVLWFDTLFTERFCPEHPVELSTSPFGPPTHWGQAVLTLAAPLSMAPAASAAGSGAAVAVEGQISMARSKHKHRSLDIALIYSAVSANGNRSEPTSLMYAMKVNS